VITLLKFLEGGFKNLYYYRLLTPNCLINYNLKKQQKKTERTIIKKQIPKIVNQPPILNKKKQYSLQYNFSKFKKENNFWYI
jgi:hypothetical protein